MSTRRDRSRTTRVASRPGLAQPRGVSREGASSSIPEDYLEKYGDPASHTPPLADYISGKSPGAV